MKLNRISMLLLLFMTVIGHLASAQTVIKKSTTKLLSPNKAYKFTLYQKSLPKGENQLYFTVSYDGKSVVEESELGVEIDGKVDNKMVIVGSDRSSQNSSWQPSYGERATVVDHYNEMVLSYSEDGDASKEDAQMQIIVRAYNEGVAFRYNFTNNYKKSSLNITGEQTCYTMPENTYAFYANWAQGPYSKLPLKNWEGECERPLTMELENGLVAAVGEAAMIDYSRGRFVLSDAKANTLNTKLHSEVKAHTPYATPWRVVMAGEKAIDIINNNDIFLNLNDPCEIEDPTWIKPGKVFRSGLKDVEVRATIDFVAAHGMQYAHLDAGWYGPERSQSSDATMVDKTKDLDIKALCDYAASKGVGILLYVNKIALKKQLDDILPLYKEWGVKGIKFGFVDVGDQESTAWMHEAVRKCAEYGLMVDIHDEYRPTGFSRTYPNLMTQEGIRGNEEMPDATNNTTLPFTRFVCGAGDYTLCYFSKRILTTHAHQLAMAAVYYSPLQFMFWYDSPKHYQGEKELDYWKIIPTVWDDSRALDGEVGQYITMARRRGDEWFVGSMTNVDARTVTITTDFLDKGREYLMTLYEDNFELNTRTNVEITTRTVKKGDTFDLDLKASGGAAMHFKPL